MLFRLLEQGVDGKMYNAIRSIYSESTCAVRVNDSMTDFMRRHKLNNIHIMLLKLICGDNRFLRLVFLLLIFQKATIILSIPIYRIMCYDTVV